MLWHFAAFSQGIAFHHWVFFFFFQSFHCAASHYSHSLLLSLVDAFLFCVACTYYKYLTRTSGRAQSVLITHTLARKGSLSIEFRFLFCLRGVVAVGVISCFVNGGLFFFFETCGIYINSKERVGQCTCRQGFHVVHCEWENVTMIFRILWPSCAHVWWDSHSTALICSNSEILVQECCPHCFSRLPQNIHDRLNFFQQLTACVVCRMCYKLSMFGNISIVTKHVYLLLFNL